MNDFKNKFRIEELLIAKAGAWNISLRPKQVTIGSLVLSLDRACPNMSDIRPEEAQQLSEAFKKIQRIFDHSFQPEKINYLVLMMVDQQVHFHVIPRYANQVIYREQPFEDKSWPKPPILQETLDMEEDFLFSLRDFLKDATKR